MCGAGVDVTGDSGGDGEGGGRVAVVESTDDNVDVDADDEIEKALHGDRATCRAIARMAMICQRDACSTSSSELKAPGTGVCDEHCHGMANHLERWHKFTAMKLQFLDVLCHPSELANQLVKYEFAHQGQLC